MKLKLLPFLILAFLIATNISGAVRAQASDRRYFEKTGYWVRGYFLEHFDSATDPLLIFGYPISNEHINRDTQLLTQYFQKARFELHSCPDGPCTRLTPLGYLLYQQGVGQPVPEYLIDSYCQFFPATGKKVCLSFKDFYNANNGAAFLGNPISGAEIHGGDRYVQYFEYARMEWRPELPHGQRIALADLGRIYIDTYNIDLSKTGGSNIVNPIPVIKAHAFVGNPLLPGNSTQTMHIITLDQDFSAIEGASIDVHVLFPDDTSQTYRPPDTNSDGISYLEFGIGNLPVMEIVKIQVFINYMGLQTSTTTWFRTWW